MMWSRKKLFNFSNFNSSSGYSVGVSAASVYFSNNNFFYNSCGISSFISFSGSFFVATCHERHAECNGEHQY